MHLSPSLGVKEWNSQILMSEENTTADVEADQNTTEINNTSVEQFTQRRVGLLDPEPSSETEEPKDSSEGEEETATLAEESNEEAAEEAVEEEPQGDVLSQLDINNLSEDELRELSEKLGSRAVARFGEMTAARKAAEEKAAQLEQMLHQKDQDLLKREVQNNPFSDLDTLEKLQDKSDEIDNTIEWAEEVLFESDDYSADDVVTEVDGKELTKKEIRKALLNARKAQKEYIPDQLSKLKIRSSGRQLQQQYDSKARTELDWLGEKDNPIKEKFFNTLRDPQYNKMKEILDKELPQVSGQLEYMFAHAANSIYGRKLISETEPKATKATGKSPSLTPTKTGSTSAAKSEKPTNKTSVAIKDLQERFAKSGSASDFAALRKLQMQNR
jgi:hypothetical protein